MLAESPEFVDSAKRNLIFSRDRPRLCPWIELELLHCQCMTVERFDPIEPTLAKFLIKFPSGR